MGNSNKSAQEVKAMWDKDPSGLCDTYGRVTFHIFKHDQAAYVKNNVTVAMKYFRGTELWHILAQEDFWVKRAQGRNLPIMNEHHAKYASVDEIKNVVLSFVGENVKADSTNMVDIYVSFDSHPSALAVTIVPGAPSAEHISISKQLAKSGAGSAANIAHEFMHVLDYYDVSRKKSLPYAVGNAVDYLIKLELAKSRGSPGISDGSA